MKRCIILFLILLNLFSFAGCKQKKTDFVEPVVFYYCSDITDNNISDASFHNVFVPETHEGAGFSNDAVGLLSLYLNGPLAQDLVSPFPSGMTVIAVQTNNEKTTIILSDEFAELTGLDLTIACTCLAMTVFQWNECDFVEISAESVLLDKQSSITIEREKLVFSDNAYVFADD